MKKLTTGIFTVLLGLVAVDANAAVTSRAYVDQEIGKVQGSVTTLESTVTEFRDGINTTITNRITEELNSDTSEISKALDSKASAADLKDIDARLYTAEDDISALEGTVGTAELGTTNKTLTGAINELNTSKVTQDQVTTIITNSITAEEGAIKDAIDTAVSDKADKTQVATDIANAVKVETDRATAAEKANADAIGALDTAYKAADTALNTAVEKAQADATQALNESIKKVTTTGEDGTYVLTIKTLGDVATLKWEQIERADPAPAPTPGV